MPRSPKPVVIKARVTTEMKEELDSLAEERGESEAIILREAVAEYIAKRKKPPVVKNPPK